MKLYPYILIRDEVEDNYLLDIPNLPQNDVMRIRYFASQIERLNLVPPFSRDELITIVHYSCVKRESPEKVAERVAQLSLFPQELEAQIWALTPPVFPRKRRRAASINQQMSLPGME